MLESRPVLRVPIVIRPSETKNNGVMRCLLIDHLRSLSQVAADLQQMLMMTRKTNRMKIDLFNELDAM